MMPDDNNNQEPETEVVIHPNGDITEEPVEPKKKSNAGRPTDFKPEFIDGIIDFFSVEPYTEKAYETSEEYFADGRLKKKAEKLRMIPNTLPTLFRFSRTIGVAYSTVWRWMKKGDDLISKLEDPENALTDEELTEEEKGLIEFCNAYKEAQELQKEFLIANGLSGTAPPAAYIFTAKNLTDMRDKVETDVTSLGEKLQSNTIILKDFNGNGTSG